MRKTPLAVSTFRLKNFKAVRDSGTIRFTPLTVFIGNNGAGKSSLVEGLETLRLLAADGLNEAMERWRGGDYIWNKATSHNIRERNGVPYFTNPMRFQVTGATQDDPDGISGHTFRGISEITPTENRDEVFFVKEELRQTRQQFVIRDLVRDVFDRVTDASISGNNTRQPLSSLNLSIFSAEPSIARWQFVRLSPDAMAYENPMNAVRGRLLLSPNGSNLAEYLLDIRRRDFVAFNGIIETMQTILPYVRDVQPVITREVGRSAYLRLTEGNYRLPSWLLSTGTLRVVALLALFRHPKPPPLIVIEELENGLDPRTISLIIEEIREVVRSGRSQVIITTHSPYLLDLVPLSSLVFVERVDGQPTFTRPSDDKSVQRWSEDFGPGRLYTMGRFGKDA